MVFYFITFLVITNSLTFPMFRQCDPRWASQKLGTHPSQTICSDGCLISSAAMALNAIGNSQINPNSLNRWLIANQGFYEDDLFLWASIDPLGVSFQGFVRRDKVKETIDRGLIAIANVDNGGHWVLVTGYQGDKILVNDPFYQRNSYELSEIVQGFTGTYSINRRDIPKIKQLQIEDS